MTDTSLLWTMIGGAVTFLPAFAGFVWWLSGQFNSVREQIVQTFHAHELKDAERFETINVRLVKLETQSEHGGNGIAGYGG